MAGTVATIGAGGSQLAPRYSPVGRAEAAPTLVTGPISQGLAYLIGGGDDDDDVDEVMAEEANELWDETYAYAVEREPDDQDALDSMATNADLLSQEIRRNASFIIAEEAAVGQDEEDVIEAAEEEIAETVKNYQKNMVQRWERHITRLQNRWEVVQDEAELDVKDVFLFYDGEGSSYVIYDDIHSGAPEVAWEELMEEDLTHTREYVDGEEFDTYIAHDGGMDGDMYIDFTRDSWGSEQFHEVRFTERDGNGTATVLDVWDYSDVWHSLEELYEDELEHVETLVDLLYQPIADGEADAHDVASGSAILEEAEEMENYQHAAAPYRAIAMPEGEAPVVIEVDGMELEGLLFWTLPSGDGLPVGETIYPSDEIGDFYAGLEVVDVDDEIEVDDDNGDDSDLDDEDLDEDDGGEPVSVQLTEPFEIVGIDGGGDTLYFDQVTHIEPDGQEDHEEIIAALEEAYEQRQETREERQEIVIELAEDDIDLGLGGFPDPDSSVLVRYAAYGVAGVAAISIAVGTIVKAIHPLK